MSDVITCEQCSNLHRHNMESRDIDDGSVLVPNEQCFKSDYKSVVGKFSALAVRDMSGDEALDLRKVMSRSDEDVDSVLSVDEIHLLRKAKELLESCLQLHKQSEATRSRVSRRATAFIAMYCRKAGKNLLAEAVSCKRNFISFLLLVHEMGRRFVQVSRTEDNVVLSRGGIRSARSTVPRSQPYSVRHADPCYYSTSEAPLLPSHAITCGPPPSVYNLAVAESSSTHLTQLDADEIEFPPEVVENIIGLMEEFPDLSGLDLDHYFKDPIQLARNDCSNLIGNQSSTPLYNPSPSGSYSSSPTSPSYSLPDVETLSASSMYSSPIHYSPIESPTLLTGSWSTSLAVEKQMLGMNINMFHVQSEPRLNAMFPRSSETNPASGNRTFRTATDELVAQISPADKDRSLRKLAAYSDEELLQSIQADADGDTGLMLAYANNTEVALSDLYSLTERLKNMPRTFLECNKQRLNALYFAVTEKKDKPYIAGYLAETMVSLNLPLSQTFDKGNTIVHVICQLGDGYAEVLRYLLRVRSADGRTACNLNAYNHEGRSPLHEAVLRHSRAAFSCYRIIKLLVESGADLTLNDNTSGRTAVHIAVEKRDFEILCLLLSNCPSAANVCMYNRNTPLHSAAAMHQGVPEKEQLSIVQLLLHFGADKTLRNSAKKLPIELVLQDRLDVKKCLMARQRN